MTIHFEVFHRFIPDYTKKSKPSNNPEGAQKTTFILM